MPAYLQVTTTVAAEDAARRIATALVEQNLAACVQIVGPVTSVYRWQGQIETAAEWQCVAKTRNDCFAALVDAIKALHDYEVPEIIATPIVCGSKAYLAWIDEQIGSP